MIESAKSVIDDNSVIARECVICDEPFEIRDMYDKRIICPRCRVFMDYIHGDRGRKLAIEAWNRRAGDEQV